MANGEIVAKYKLALHIKLIDAAVAVTDGVWMDTGQYENTRIEISGITTGTVEIRGSNAAAKPLNTAHGTIIGTAFTADGYSEILVLPRWIKARVTAWTTGTFDVLAMLRGTK